MFYFLVNIAVAVWMYFDGTKRRFNAVPWSLGATLLAVIVTPIYLAKRPLLEGEVREGGFAWNALKYFAVGWTILMLGSAFIGIINASTVVDHASSEAEQIGASIGVTLGLGLLCTIWFFPLAGTAALAFMLRKPSVIERGSATSATYVAPPTVSASPVAAAPWKQGSVKPGNSVRSSELTHKPDLNRGGATSRRPPPPPPPPKRP